MTQVLITGAGGFLGSHLIPALSRAGYKLICCGRNAASLRRKFPGCRVVECDLASRPGNEFWDVLLREVTVVINAAGIIQEHAFNTFEAVHRDGPTELFRSAERAGVRRIIQISALGADIHATTRYHRTKWAADEVLRGLSLEWVVLQPSLVYGPGGRSQAFFSALAAMPVIGLVGAGMQRIQPVHVEDVVQGILRLLPSDAPSRMTLPLVGPEPVTFRRFLETIRAWLGLGVAPTITIPLTVVQVATRIGDVVRSDFMNSDTLAMLCRGNTADPTPFITVTGVTPRSLSAGLPSATATDAERLAASLFFLRPLLVFSIAAVWIGSGVVSLFVFPQETSEAWLIRVGISENWASRTLMAAATLDIVLGLATLVRFWLPLVLTIQLLLIVGFSLILTVRMPELWGHPFGPLLKNLPLFAATLVLWALERRR